MGGDADSQADLHGLIPFHCQQQTGMLEVRPFIGEAKLVVCCSLNGGNVLTAVAEKLADMINDVAGPQQRLTSDDVFRQWQTVDFDAKTELKCVPRLFGDRGVDDQFMR